MLGSVDVAKLPLREAAALRALEAVRRLGDGPVPDHIDYDRGSLREFLDAVEEHRESLERDVSLILGLSLMGVGVGVDFTRITAVMDSLEATIRAFTDPHGQWINPTKPSIRAGLELYVRTWLYVMRHDSQEQQGMSALAATSHSEIRIEHSGMIIDAAFTVVETRIPGRAPLG